MTRSPVQIDFDLRNETPLFWANPGRSLMSAAPDLGLGRADLFDAEARLKRFAPLLVRLFPDLQSTGGLIESDLLPAAALAPRLGNAVGPLGEHLWIKADHHLPVAGSIKARGGIYAVLEYAERVAQQANLLNTPEDYCRLADEPARKLFATHHLSVGSTGNLGLSIGIMGTALGFRVTVHMSVEAKTWKKERLRRHGVNGVEHSGGYTSACAIARAQRLDPFVLQGTHILWTTGGRFVPTEIQAQFLQGGLSK